VDVAADTKTARLAAASMFLWALVPGVWKYEQIVSAPSRRSRLHF
jgi:hypothetical protein